MITITFLTNFALGFILAAEFGQTSVEVFRRGIDFGLKQSILVSLGGAFADFVYLNIAIAGILIFLNHPETLRVLWLLGGATLTYLAVSGLRNALRDEFSPNATGKAHPFVTGFLLNFVHPLNLVYWVTILSSIVVKDIEKNSFQTAYLDGLGIPLGVLAWWLVLSVLTAFFRNFISKRITKYISIGSSLLLFGFAVWFFYSAFT